MAVEFCPEEKKVPQSTVKCVPDFTKFGLRQTSTWSGCCLKSYNQETKGYPRTRSSSASNREIVDFASEAIATIREPERGKKTNPVHRACSDLPMHNQLVVAMWMPEHTTNNDGIISDYRRCDWIGWGLTKVNDDSESLTATEGC